MSDSLSENGENSSSGVDVESAVEYPSIVRLPHSLNALLDADRLIVQQDAYDKSERRSAYLNSYEVIANSASDQWEKLISFQEESTRCMRACCRNYRRFTMRGTVNGQTELVLERPLRCPANLCCCCPYELRVLRDGECIGSVGQAPSLMHNKFILYDGDHYPQLVLKGPIFAYHCCLDLVFKLYSCSGGRSIGRLIRRWRNDQDVFHVAFPRDLHIRMKLLLMTATVLIDFVYFGSH